MDIFDEIRAHFSSLVCIRDWQEAQQLFERVGSARPDHWLLPLCACEAVGGRVDQVMPVLVAIASSYISIILVDDMLDSDARGEYRRIGHAATANLACAFQSAGLEAVTRCGLPSDVRLAILDSINQMSLTTSLGQYWDVQYPMDEVSYWRIARTKSSPFFGAALHIGALAGGAPADEADRLKDLGSLYGEMIQIYDDLNDALEVPANPDWLTSQSSLPLLFTKIVDHPARCRFQELCSQVGDAGKLEEAQAILIRCGAISYGIDQLLDRFHRCREILDSLSLCRPRKLETLIDELFEPIRKLMDALELPEPSLSAIPHNSAVGISDGSNSS